MATVTHDGQSLLIDGRRTWLISGMIDFFRIPRDIWRARIQSAHEAGLNAVVVRCPWFVHEPRKGEFSFDGQADIAAFIQLIADAGMKCILRVGPYIGHDVDLGGMPSWLLAEPNIRLRESNAAFLEATSRYLGRLLKALSSHSARNNGPICLVQVEHEWHCGNQEMADGYLLEIARFIREHDFDLPLINTNNLWQRREETIDTWCGRDQMLKHLRQLRAIHPSWPLFVGDFWLSDTICWSDPLPAPPNPAAIIHELAQILAAGAQFNIAPFHSGTNFDFMGGRQVGSLNRFAVTSAEEGPIGEAGQRTASFAPIRRVCTFATQFSKVFASLAPAPQSAVLGVETISEGGRKGRRPSHSVVHLQGAQGDVVFVFADEQSRNESTSILLPSGRMLPIHFGAQPVTWCVMNMHIGGRAKLDWTNLNAFALNNHNLCVLYGPAGRHGQISINYGVIDIEVPRGAAPLVQVHEDVAFIVVNEEAVDFTCLRDNVVYVGIDGFDPNSGESLPAHGWKTRYEVEPSGKVTSKPNCPVMRKPSVIPLTEWSAASVDDHINGTAPRFATIDGPQTQEQCAAGSGYGFIRMTLPKSAARKIKVLSPGAGDRIHLYVKGQLAAIAGFGAGASGSVVDLPLPTGKNPVIVALVDNLGRYGGGNMMHEGKGIISHLHEVKVRKLNKPAVVDGPPLSPFVIRGFIEGCHGNSMTVGKDLLWNFEHRTKSTMILEIEGVASPAIVLLNGQIIAFYSGQTGKPQLHMVLNEANCLRKGKNELRLATLYADVEAEFTKGVRLYDVKSVLTEKAVWAFAKWEQPRPNVFKPLNRNGAKSMFGRPAWYRTTFDLTRAGSATWFEPGGLSKGQIYLNGMNIGRYFVATMTGAAVGPQKRFLLPESWLKIDQPNELVVFDEHGKDPTKSRIVFTDNAFV